MECFSLFFRYRRLIWSLVFMDFKVRYAGSRLGLLWTLLSPLLVLGAYLLLFGKILGVRPDPALSSLDYGLLMACGLLPWLGFSEGIMRGTGSVLAQRNLMKSTVFPMELIPVTAVCAGLVIQMCGIVVLFNHVPNLTGLAAFSGLALAALLTGYQYFMRLRRVLPDFV